MIGLAHRTLADHPSSPMLELIEVVWGKNYEKAETRLVNYVASTLPTGVHNRRGLHALLLGYAGKEVGSYELARLLQKRKQVALEWRKMVYDKLDVLHNRALGLLEEVMRERGLI